MNARNKAVEQTARALYADILQGRTATFSTADTQFRHDVLTRLNQLMAGETSRWEDPDD